MGKERKQWRETVPITTAWPEKDQSSMTRKMDVKNKPPGDPKLPPLRRFTSFLCGYFSIAHLQYAQGKVWEFDHMAVGGTIWQGGYQTLTQVLDNQQIILLVLIEEIISAVILNISRTAPC